MNQTIEKKKKTVLTVSSLLCRKWWI